jgi:hypothetical protein
VVGCLGGWVDASLDWFYFTDGRYEYIQLHFSSVLPISLFPKCPSFSTIQSYAPNIVFYLYR